MNLESLLIEYLDFCFLDTLNFVDIWIQIHYNVFNYLIYIIYLSIFDGENPFRQLHVDFQVLIFDKVACLQVLIHSQLFEF